MSSRYDIAIGRVLEMPVMDQAWSLSPPVYEQIQDGLCVTFERLGEMPFGQVALMEAAMNRMMHHAMKRYKDEWEFKTLAMYPDKDLDKLSIKCIFKKAKQNALSPASTLGSGEQRAGIINPYNGTDTLHDLWRPNASDASIRNNQP